MKAIYKYQLGAMPKQVVDIPLPGLIIRTEDVGGRFYIWAIVDTELESRPRFFEMYKTGQPIETPLCQLFHLGHCKIDVGMELCLYVFENTIGWNTEKNQ